MPARIDTQNPVNRDHPVNAGLGLWWLGLPHLSGGDATKVTLTFTVAYSSAPTGGTSTCVIF